MYNAQELIKRYERALKLRQPKWDPLWQNIADYVVPRKSSITDKKTPGAEDWVNNIYSDVASNANIVMAAGMVTNSTPITNKWVAFEVDDVVKAANNGAPEAVRYFAEASSKFLTILQRSNFYTQIHEAHLERNPFGTCLVFCDEGSRNILNFKTIPIGTYCLEEDYEGFVDTVFVESMMTARKIEQQFGAENLGELVKKALSDENQRDKEFRVIHLVEPRKDRDPKKIDKLNKPYASVYFCVEDKNILLESGYDEMCYAAGRYLRWPGEVYGWGPGLQVLPIVRQLNFIEKQADIISEKMADPPSLTPSNLAGQADFRAGGNTVFDENTPGAVPQFMQLTARLDGMQWRVDKKEKSVRDAFHNDLFQMFSQIDSSARMTQIEVMQRAGEKLEQFSPAFTSWDTEVLTPLMRRAFSICFRAGLFGEPPADAFVNGSLVMPKFVYSSKLSLALKSLDNRALIDAVNVLLPMAQVDPTVMDRVNLDGSTKMVLENFGVPPKCIRRDEEVAMIQQQRAEQQQAMAQMAALEQGSKAAANLGKAPQEMRDSMSEQLA